MSILPLTAILGGVYWAQVPSDRFPPFLCMIISFLNALVLGNRTAFIYVSVLLFASYTLTRSFVYHKPLGKLLKPLLLCAVLLVVGFVYVGSLRFSNSHGSISDISEMFYARFKIPWTVLHAYSYLTGGFGAFSRHLESPIFVIPIPGLHTFSPVIRMLARFHYSTLGYSYQELVTYSVIREFVSIPIYTNVFTYLGPLFDDFSLWGVFLATFGMGFFSNRIFQRLLAQPSFLVIGIYSLFCLQFIYSTAAIITHDNTILVSIFALFLIQKYVSSREGKRCIRFVV
jgi:oligosaccharide repeat unit polymerase